MDLKAVRARCGKGHMSLRHLAAQAQYCIDPLSDGGRGAAESLADIPALIAEVERLRLVERHAREVMAALEEHGPGIVGHLLDNDDNSGERLRQALGMTDA